MEQAGESLARSGEAGGSVEDVLEEALDVEVSEQAAAGLDEGHQVRGAMLRRLVEPGAVDDAGGLVGEHLRDAEVLLVVQRRAGGDGEVEHADGAALDAQGNDDARCDRAVLWDEVDEGVFLDLVEEQRLT